jgi:hypothetical protein
MGTIACILQLIDIFSDLLTNLQVAITKNFGTITIAHSPTLYNTSQLHMCIPIP